MAAFLIGTINDRNPVVRAAVGRAGDLILGIGDILLVVDTGYTGDIALPKSVLRLLKLNFMGFAGYQLADGTNKDIPQWLGTTAFFGRRPARKYTIFMEGDFLIGMEFMMDNCIDLAMNFDARCFRLAIR